MDDADAVALDADEDLDDDDASEEDDDEEDAEMVIEQPFGYGDEPVGGALLDLSNTEESPRKGHSYAIFFVNSAC